MPMVVWARIRLRFEIVDEPFADLPRDAFICNSDAGGRLLLLDFSTPSSEVIRTGHGLTRMAPEQPALPVLGLLRCHAGRLYVCLHHHSAPGRLPRIHRYDQRGRENCEAPAWPLIR